MTKTEIRRINGLIRQLRADRKAIASGQRLHWGTAWCTGPGGLGHTEPPEICEGCAIREWCQAKANALTPEIGRLQGLLVPQLQGALF